MKILFINLPYQGHVIPTIGLVQELVKAGHPVTYLMPQDWADTIADSGAAFLGYENHPQLDKQIRNAFFKAEEVIASHDLVLYEQFFFVGRHLAQKHGKSCIRIFTAPATNQYLMRQFISSGGPMGIFRLPLIGTLWTMDAVKGLGIKLKCRNWLDEIVENPPDCNLVYTLPSFQPCAKDSPRGSSTLSAPRSITGKKRASQACPSRSSASAWERFSKAQRSSSVPAQMRSGMRLSRWFCLWVSISISPGLENSRKTSS